MRQLPIGDKEVNQRLDKFLQKYFNKAPKSFIYKMLRKKRIKLNNKTSHGSEILMSGDVLNIYFSDETYDSMREDVNIAEVKITFGIIFEDENICVINKPAGLLSHPERAEDTESLSNQFVFYLTKTQQYTPGGGYIPAICNRLDRNTSGIIIGGKNMIALQSLNSAFKNGQVRRFYTALCSGRINGTGRLSGFIVKDKANNRSVIIDERLRASYEDASPVLTLYKSVQCSDDYSLLELELKTGKSHQIRAHLHSIHHPVVGDKKYGSPDPFMKKLGLNHQFLHAGKISFNNLSGSLEYLNGREFVCELPSRLREIEQRLFS